MLYKDMWFQFVKRAKDTAFLINPKPKFTSDIVDLTYFDFYIGTDTR